MKNARTSRKFFSAALTALQFFAAGAALAQETPDVTIRRAVDGVTSTLSADKAILTGDRRRINHLVDEKVMPYVSIVRMTQSALGPAWARATPEQRQALTAEFKRLLTNTYAGAFTSYQPDTKIEYRPLRLSTGDSDATVRSLVSAGGAEPIPLDYYLEQIDGAWKVTDFGVFGVRMVETYKGQFRGAVASSGVDGLIKALEMKNSSNEARGAQ
jgi:phospholipid transport system substrate-binding protein